jgi:non-lysosomal glucosylceramidase
LSPANLGAPLDSSTPLPPPGGTPAGSCQPGNLPRRDFLRLSGLAATGLALGRFPAVAGPFGKEDFEKLVPADKKLKPEWVKSLFERGQRTVYKHPDLASIGMPIGGLCCGQVYLGGDGKLWHWDIFNRHVGTGDGHYARPMKPASPFLQGFFLATRDGAGGPQRHRGLGADAWRDVSFTGEYPIGYVEYRDPDCPATVSLEAFSPFIPHNVEDSSLPCTVLRFTIKNTGTKQVLAELMGYLENAVCLHSGTAGSGQRRNRLMRQEKLTFLECSAEAAPRTERDQKRPDIVFDDFERETYETWTPTGTAFGTGPVAQDKMPDYQGKVEAHGRRLVNSHASAPGANVTEKDSATGTLTSRTFTIERDYISFLIGGGAHKDRTCMNLLVEEKVVLSATGRSENRLSPHSWDVRPWAGKQARFQIVDNEKGGWGNIGLDHIVFTDQAGRPPAALTEQPDYGTMGLALLSTESEISNLKSRMDSSVTGLPGGDIWQRPMVPANEAEAPATKPFGEKLVGLLARQFTLEPGESGTVTFLVTWHFPNLKMDRLPPGRHYGTRFKSANEVAGYVASNFDHLASQTRLWHDTWYDSTLPYWFLDRTFLNTSILATSTAFRFANGRFWGWEGVGCCHGTCGHVWQYAQAMARLFPTLERDTRERVDFGSALQKDGAIFFRGEFNNIPAIDAQAGTILRALREHQMCTDSAWLKKNWPGIRKATEWLIKKDANDDGLIESNQHNTLDTDWFGPVAWLSGMYLAALRAGEVMAKEVGDTEFAQRCHGIFAKGQPKFVAELFDGEYFINKPDPRHLDAINSGTGCHIDQVFGQSWAFQVGLDRVLPEKETRSALKSLWRYNFTPDVGPYRAAYKPGRWYAMPGEGGLLMCSFPRQDWDYAQAKGRGPEWAAGYFNECMNGFEYQAAWHMIAEGMVMEGLAVTRMIHDRYHASRRNPWNEVECGDHYARSMASYGVFLAACGFEYDGPKARLGFAPRLTPENFRAAFTAAEGWGTYAQKVEGRKRQAEIILKWGQLKLRTLALGLPANEKPTRVTATVAGKPVAATLAEKDGKAEISFAQDALVKAGEKLEVALD